MILLIDNFDSFVHNLARYFVQLDRQTLVVRNNAITADDVLSLRPEAVVISPGPGTPADAGCSLEVVRRCWRRFPMLGVCLGHQTIAAALGARIVRAPEPMHGRTSLVRHDDRGVFAGLPQPLSACRYHSLVVEEATLPTEWEVSARTDDGTVMGIRHAHRPVVGVQFHPESILTQAGYELLANFLRLGGLHVPSMIPAVERTASGFTRRGDVRATETPAVGRSGDTVVTF